MNRGPRLRKWLLASVMASAILGAASLQAQVIDGTSYVFSETTGAALEDMTGATKLIGIGAEDTLSQVEPIGFDYWMNGTRYDRFFVSSNGSVFLGGIHTTNATSYNLGAGTSNPMISVYADDLLVTASPGAGVSYKVTGTAPNRKLVVQWSGMKIPYTFSDTTLTNSSPQTNTMQAMISEGSGLIEFVYGDGIVANANGYGIGISTGGSAGQFASVTVGAPSTASSATLNNGNTLALASTVKFTFTPRATSAPTLGTVSTTTNSVSLGWTNTATGYYTTEIYVSTDGGTTYEWLASLPSGTNSFVHSNTGSSGNYRYRLHHATEGALSAATAAGPVTTDAGGIAAGTVTVGAGDTFTNLTSAFANLDAVGSAGPVTLELQADYNPAGETYPLVVPDQFGPGNPLTITVASGAGPFTLSANLGADATADSTANATMVFNGSSHVTIDGGASKAITIENTANTSNPNVAAVLFLNESRNSTLTNLNLRGSGIRSFTTNDNAVVQLRGTTGTRGNDNITISNSTIGPAGTNLPQNGILSVNTSLSTPAYNDRLTITGNEISDYFEAATANRGVFIGQGTDATTVSNNKVFQTAPRTFTSSNIHSGIAIDNGGVTIAHGRGHTISGNTIGYASNAGTGTWTYDGTGTRFIGVNVFNSYGSTTVANNTVSNISVATSSGASANPGVLSGITYGNTGSNNGKVTVSGNTVGATTADDQLLMTTTTTGSMMGGILVATSGIATVENNTVRGLAGVGSGVTTGTVVRAINVAAGTLGAGGNDHIVRNNTVGVDPSISTQSIRSQGVGSGNTLVFGVHGTLGTFNRGVGIWEGNTVQSLFANSPSSVGGRVIGMELRAGYLSVNGNTVRGLACTALNPGTSNTAAAIGITVGNYTSSTPSGNDRAWGVTVSGNSVSDIAYNPTTPATVGTVQGILYFFNAPPTGATQSSRVSGNRVSNLTTASTSTGTSAPVLNGIYNLVQNANATVDTYNNFVSLGENELDGNAAIFGLRVNAGTGTTGQNIWHNSVYIGGTGNTAGAGTTAALLRTGAPATGTTDVRNNILFNNRTNGPGGTSAHLALFYNGGTGSLVSNNNLVGGTDPAAFFVGATPTLFQTLPLWQASPGTPDLQSLQGNPGYVSGPANDLHITDCFEGAGLGATIAAVTTDIDGNSRPAAPDMGADEITEVPQFPTAQGSAVAVTQADCDTLDVSWTAASPSVDGYVVVRRIGGAPTGAPSVYRASQYAVSDAIGDGTVVYVGTGTSFADSGLVSGDNANYAVFSFNGGSCFRYLAAAPATGSGTVVGGDPAAQPTNLTSATQTTSSIDLAWDAASPAPTGYIVLAIPGTAAPGDVPVDGTTYAANDPIGASTVVYAGTGTSFSHAGLPADTDYAYAVFSYDTASGCTSYLTAAPLTGTFSTMAVSTVNEWNTIE